jgi:rhamnogalacturonyl hydrolase YesR
MMIRQLFIFRMDVWGKLIFGFVLNVHLLFAQEPSKYVERIADKIIEESKLELVQAPAKTWQEKTYLIDFGLLPNFTTNEWQTAEAQIANLSTDVRVELGFSASAGELEIWFDKTQLYSKKILENQAIERIDYDFVLFPQKVTVPFKAQKLTVRFKAKERKAQLLLGFFDAKSGMTLVEPKFSPVGDDQYFTFDDNQTPQARQVSTGKGNVEFSDWRYFTGTFLTALSDAAEQYQKPAYHAFIQKHNRFFLENNPKIARERQQFGLREGLFTLYFRYRLLDDFAPQTTALLGQKPALEEQKQYEQLLKKALETIEKKVERLPDRTFARITPDSMVVQSDDLFMGGIFLIRAAKHLKRPDLLDDAAQQAIRFHQYLFDQKTGLYKHAYFTRTQRQSTTCWGRGMGWVMMIEVELLRNMPQNHALRPQILSNFKEVCKNLLNYQSKDGRWHQVVNDPTSYLETSATAMFLRAYAEGITENWLNKNQFMPATLLAWQGLQTQIQADGQVQNIVRGTPILESDEAYSKHKTRLNDPRGLGAVLWAIMSVDKLFKK